MRRLRRLLRGDIAAFAAWCSVVAGTCIALVGADGAMHGDATEICRALVFGGAALTVVGGGGCLVLARRSDVQ